MFGFLLYPIDMWIEYHNILYIRIPAILLSLVGYVASIMFVYKEMKSGVFSSGLKDTVLAFVSFIILSISALFWIIDIVPALIIYFMKLQIEMISRGGNSIFWLAVVFEYIFVLFSMFGMLITGIAVISVYLRRTVKISNS